MSLPVPTWNGCDHSIDNLMSIVVQSLKINGHNYSLESTFLIRNLSGRCGYAPDRTAVFVRNELSQWVLDNTANEIDGCTGFFPVRRTFASAPPYVFTRFLYRETVFCLTVILTFLHGFKTV